MIKRQDLIVFDEVPHTYTNSRTGLRMTPVSKVKDMIKEPFDGELISGIMAKALVNSRGGGSDRDIAIAKAGILAEWKATALKATDRGTKIHKIIEALIPFVKESDSVLNIKIADACGREEYYIAVRQIIFSLRKYYQNCSEYLLYSEFYNVCGTGDHFGIRQNTKNSLVDIDDWKTNEFTFDSIKIKNGIVKHGNKMLLAPLEYLEESKYTDLALQLSIYGVLFESTYPGLRIGRLTGHNINHAGEYTPMPVPYMRREAIALLDHFKSLKKLPTSTSGTSQPVIAYNEEDEW